MKNTLFPLRLKHLQSFTRYLSASGHGSLSKLGKAVLRRYLTSEKQVTHDARELELIDRNSDRLNQEAEDVLGYQMEL